MALKASWVPAATMGICNSFPRCLMTLRMALLEQRPREHVLYLVDDEQLYLDRREQAQHFVLQLSGGLRGPKRGEDLAQDLRIEAPLVGNRRRLHRDHRDARSDFAVAFLRRVLTHESAEHCRLTVVGFAHDEQIGHPMRFGKEQKLFELG